MGWLQALHTVVCGTKSDQASGSLPFYAFPNELLKAIVERTGGRPVQLTVPKVSEGTVEIDDEGRCFLVEQVDGGDGQMYTKATFLMAVTRMVRLSMTVVAFSGFIRSLTARARVKFATGCSKFPDRGKYRG